MQVGAGAQRRSGMVMHGMCVCVSFFFFQAEDGIRDVAVTGVQTCALPISFHKDVTLRQLMSHRAGLLREPPVGNYFDPSELSLSAMVHSLNDTTLVYPPESHTKYSNAGVATVGYVLEKHSRSEEHTSELQSRLHLVCRLLLE